MSLGSTVRVIRNLPTTWRPWDAGRIQRIVGSFIYVFLAKIDRFFTIINQPTSQLALIIIRRESIISIITDITLSRRTFRARTVNNNLSSLGDDTSR